MRLAQRPLPLLEGMRLVAAGLGPVAGLPPSALRVYLVICRLYDEGRIIRFRAIGAELGVGMAFVQQTLPRLAAAGFVTYQQQVHGDRRIIPGSIVPLRRVELFAPECFGCQATA